MLGTEGEREEPDNKQKGAFNAAPLTQDTGEIHGDWLVVTRRKRSPKVPPKNNSLAHLANSFEKLSIPSKAVTHVGSKRKGTDFYVLMTHPILLPQVTTKLKVRGELRKEDTKRGPHCQQLLLHLQKSNPLSQAFQPKERDKQDYEGPCYNTSI